MKMPLATPGLLLALLALVVQTSLAGAVAGVEELRYRVIYSGVFSAGKDMPIADLTLQTRYPGGPEGLRETRLEATSRHYPLVESLYPIRYRFRSWSTAGGQDLVGFETFEQTRKRRHRLCLRDDETKRGLRRYKVGKGAGRIELAALEDGRVPLAAVPGGLLDDRLGLLQRVRGQLLHEHASFRFTASDGRDRLICQVKVESAELLNLAGRRIPAWKLRFDGNEIQPDGKTRAAHRPMFIWLSRSAAHVTLRVDSRHAIGLFRIELAPASLTAQLALTVH